VDNNYLDLGMNKSGFVHTLPSGKLSPGEPLGPIQSRHMATTGEEVQTMIHFFFLIRI
jgi:hypothetical protein